MIAGTHDALHDQSQPHSEEESKVLGDPHLLLHHLLSLYSHVVYQLSSVDQQQEQNSQRHISNVAEDVVERADETPGVSTVEVVVADVQVSSYIQYFLISED